jgi:hypothetical protein
MVIFNILTKNNDIDKYLIFSIFRNISIKDGHGQNPEGMTIL